MSISSPRADLSWWPALIIAIVLAGSSFALQGRSGFNPADEGFLWYGVQRTVAGEVPLRDFQSYDPGRYYWCAAGAVLSGTGLVALRFSETLFACLGLWAGLLAARRITSDWKLLLLIGLMLTSWMFPSHKLFDHGILLIAILLGVRLVECPSQRRIFEAGCFVGLCTFFGRNHALYGFFAIGTMLLLLHWKAPKEVPVRHLFLWCAGLGLGLTPLLGMLLFVPQFFASYRESVESIFRHGANLSLPVPWLWRLSYAGDPLTTINRILLGSLYMALPLFYLSMIALVLRLRAQELRQHPVLVAGGFVGLLYAHHAFARADVSHLAQAIHPFTLGVVAALLWWGCSRKYVWLAVAVITLAGFMEGAPQNSFYRRMVSQVPWVKFDAGDEIFIPASEARLYNCLRNFIGKNLRPQQTLLIAPVYPGFYSLLDRPSPLWELYFFFPSTVTEQKTAIRKLRDRTVDWALLSNAAIDRRPDLRFESTHQVLADYLTRNFQPVRLDCLPKGMTLFHRQLPLPNNSAGKQISHK